GAPDQRSHPRHARRPHRSRDRPGSCQRGNPPQCGNRRVAMTDAVQHRGRLREGRLTFAGLLSRFGFYLAMLILIAAFAALSPAFLTVANGVNIPQQTSTIGIMALGETLVILAGGIDVSVGSVLGLGGMVAALALRDAGAGTITAAVLGTGTGLVV